MSMISRYHPPVLLCCCGVDVKYFLRKMVMQKEDTFFSYRECHHTHHKFVDNDTDCPVKKKKIYKKKSRYKSFTQLL